MSLDRKAKALANLALARQAEFAEGAMRVYLHVLRDVDGALLARACAEWAEKPRGEFQPAMPEAAALKATAERIARGDAESNRLKALPAHSHDHREPVFYCVACLDESSGWRPFHCQGRPREITSTGHGTTVDCGRHHEHLPHSYVARCECWQQNPVVERRKAWASKREAV